MRERMYFPAYTDWLLRWALLDPMFNANFLLRREFTAHPKAVARRLRHVGFLFLLLSPLTLFHTVLLHFLRNAERLYNHPSSLARRTWTPEAAWQLREFNEAPHFLQQRLAAAQEHADAYLGQFSTPMIATVGRFVAFVAGSFAALLIVVAFVDNGML